MRISRVQSTAYTATVFRCSDLCLHCIWYGVLNGVAVTGQACLTIVTVKGQWYAIILLRIEKRTSELQ